MSSYFITDPVLYLPGFLMYADCWWTSVFLRKYLYRGCPSLLLSEIIDTSFTSVKVRLLLSFSITRSTLPFFSSATVLKNGCDLFNSVLDNFLEMVYRYSDFSLRKSTLWSRPVFFRKVIGSLEALSLTAV